MKYDGSRFRDATIQSKEIYSGCQHITDI